MSQLRQMVQQRGQQHPDVVELAVNQIMEDAAQAPAGQVMEQEVPAQPQPAEVHHIQEPLPADFLQIDCEKTGVERLSRENPLLALFLTHIYHPVK